MPNIHINTKNDFINVISTHGHAIEVDQETLDRWNKLNSEWWEMQLEMDKLLKAQND